MFGKKKVVILTNDQNGQPVDLENKVPVLSGRVVLKEGVPQIGTPEFTEWLQEWHKKNNPQYFADSE